MKEKRTFSYIMRLYGRSREKEKVNAVGLNCFFKSIEEKFLQTIVFATRLTVHERKIDELNDFRKYMENFRLQKLMIVRF